ncbi:MAG: hypothetical protein C0418_00535 [Coriobacteriaceae bacterium]|nr:hypothetical protein [Coriobacteriaceae bacterium]
MTRIVITQHGYERLRQRDLRVADVRHVVLTGEVVESDPSAQPNPRRLLLGWCAGSPLHVVVAEDRSRRIMWIVTAYRPDDRLWHPDCRRRR